MNCKTIFTALMLLLTTGAFAQSPRSVVCNPDGTVTFKYKNDQANEVMVDVSAFPAGVYVYECEGKTNKFVVN